MMQRKRSSCYWKHDQRTNVSDRGHQAVHQYEKTKRKNSTRIMIKYKHSSVCLHKVTLVCKYKLERERKRDRQQMGKQIMIECNMLGCYLLIFLARLESHLENMPALETLRR